MRARAITLSHYTYSGPRIDARAVTCALHFAYIPGALAALFAKSFESFPLDLETCGYCEARSYLLPGVRVIIFICALAHFEIPSLVWHIKGEGD